MPVHVQFVTYARLQTGMTVFGTQETRLGIVFLFAVGLALSGCGDEREEADRATSRDTVAVRGAADSMTVEQILPTDRRFSTFVASLDSTGLDSLLAEPGPYTVFAPPDSAFNALPDGTLPVLLTDRRARLRSILAHHVVEGRVRASALSDRSALVTLSGDSLVVGGTDTSLTVGTAQVLARDIEGTNGVIHVIDEVLPPPVEEAQ